MGTLHCKVLRCFPTCASTKWHWFVMGASVCKGLVKGCHKESRSFNPLNWIVHSIDWHLYHWCIVFLYSCSFIWLTLKQMLRMNEFLFLDNCSLRNGRIRILSFKVAIVLLCNAHLEEKYRCTLLFLVMTFIHSSHETYSDVAEQVSMNETTSKWNYIGIVQRVVQRRSKFSLQRRQSNC